MASIEIGGGSSYVKQTIVIICRQIWHTDMQPVEEDVVVDQEVNHRSYLGISLGSVFPNRKY